MTLPVYQRVQKKLNVNLKIQLKKTKPKINNSDITNLFSGLEEASKEAKVLEKKRKDYVETTTEDISSLFEGLEKASKEANKLNEDNKNKLSDFTNLFEKISHQEEEYPEDLPSDVEPEKEKDYEEPPEDDPTDDVSDKGSLQGWIEKKADTQPKDIVEQIVGQLDDMRYQTEVKEELDEIEKLRKEFEQYKTVLQNQITKNLATSSGSGEVRLEFLDDVDRDTAKVNGKFLKFDSSSGKFVGDDASVSDETIQDIVGNMVSSNTESGITVTYQDADGTLDFTIGTLNQDTTGNAATATALETARNIGGVSFDGTANINLPGVNTSGDQDTSGNAATATALATARTINGTSFDGTANVTVTAAAGTLTGNTLNSGVTASSLTSVGTLTTLTVDNVIVNGTTIGHTDDTDLITLADGSVTIAGNLTVSGTTTTVNQVEVNVTNAFVFEGATSDANETTLRVDDPSADRKVSIQDKTGTIALISGFKLDGTDSSKTNEGDFLVLDTSDDENDRLLFEDGTSDPIAVLASHGITLSGQGWNAFQFENP